MARKRVIPSSASVSMTVLAEASPACGRESGSKFSIITPRGRRSARGRGVCVPVSGPGTQAGKEIAGIDLALTDAVTAVVDAAEPQALNRKANEMRIGSHDRS